MNSASTVIVLATLGLVGCVSSRESATHARSARDEQRTPGALYARGLDWARRGDMVRAEQYMALAVRGGYPERQALVAIVEACLAASRLRAALNYAEPYVRRHPDAWRVRLLVASIHAALGHDLVARDEMRRTLRHPEAGAETHYLLAWLLDERFGDEAGAREAYTAYLAGAPHGEHVAEATAWLAEHGSRTTRRAEGPR